MDVNKSNYQYLFTRIDELELSVRASNCLNKTQIKYIGELAQKTEAEMMMLPNFGRKCLDEVGYILYAYGLKFGLTIINWDTLRYQYENAIQISLLEKPLDKQENIARQEERINKTSFLNLLKKVGELSISYRALHGLNDAEIVYVGDLVSKTEQELLIIKNMGRKSVKEIKSELSKMKLTLGMKIPEWSQKNIEEEIRMLSSELEMHRKHDAESLLTDTVKRANFLEEELAYFIAMFSKEKYRLILRNLFGFDGKGKRTLEEVGKEFGCTRERVRQISEKFLRKLNQAEIVKNIHLPICNNIEQYIMNRLPVQADTIEAELIDEGFTKIKFQLEGIREAMKLLGEKPSFDIIRLDRKRFLIGLGENKIPKLIIHLSKKMVSRYGLSNIAEIIDQVSQGTGITIEDKNIISVLSTHKGFSWLDESNGWFWITSVPRNRMLNIIRKILSVCRCIDVHELRAGIGRCERMDGFAPTTNTLIALCKQVSWCSVDARTVIANNIIKPEYVLGSTELTMHEIIKEKGPLLNTGEFEAACSDKGINRATFYKYLSSSPIITKYITGLYGLRGADIQPGLVESVAAATKKTRTKRDYGWTKGGNIWIVAKLNQSSMHSGVFFIPAALTQYIYEPFELKSTDGVTFGTLKIRKNFAWSISSFLKRRGYEKGDYISLTFNLIKKEVVAYIGSEEILEDYITDNK